MKRSILFAMMVSLFAVSAFAQKAPKRQGPNEFLDLENLYGNIEKVEYSHYSIDVPNYDLSKIEPSIKQVYKFDQRGNVIEMGPTALEGGIITAKYDASGKMISMTSRFNAEMGGAIMLRHTYTYGGNGKVLEMLRYYENEKQPTFRYRTSYNAKAQPISEICTNVSNGSVGYKRTYKYDSQGLLIEELFVSNDEYSDDPYKICYKYDSKGRKIETLTYEVKGAEPSISRYVYDSYGRLIEEYSPAKITYKYNSQGKKIEKLEYDINGKATSKTNYNYDTQGNLIEEISYDNGATTPSSIVKYNIVYRN